LIRGVDIEVKISISVNNQKDSFVLTPIKASFSMLRGVKVYVKNINDGYLLDEKVIIPFLGVDINYIYSRIKQVFGERFNCCLIFDESSDAVINDAKLETEKFEIFAKKAYEIRNNKIIDDELKKFIGILDGKEFKRELKSFQLLAAYHLAFSQNACNFSVPGSGKTTTVLAAYELLRHIDDDKKGVNKLLVIGPLASFFAWRSEFRECYGRDPKSLEIRGGVSTKQIEDKLLRTNVAEELILVSYGSLDGKRDILQKFLKSNKNTMVVLDEAHRIKNVDEGVQSKAALSLSPYAKARVVLTGTPAANSYVDLFNLYKFIWPANNVIGYSIPQLQNMSRNDNDFRVDDLMQRISPFFVRVKKSDLKLPNPIFNEPNIIKMSKNQRIIYDAIEKMVIRTFENSAATEIFRKSAFIRLRQAASNPKLLQKPLEDCLDEEGNKIEIGELNDEIKVDENILHLIGTYNEIPCKFEAAYNLSKKIINDGGKLIIWCEFVGTCIDLSDFLTSSKITNAILFGGTSPEDRERIILDFHNNPELSVIIANPHAVGESISLHKACHNALYLEQGYNAGVYMQSKDRIHRVGLNEEHNTNYYYFHAAESIDNIAFNRVRAKEERMLKLIESEEIPLFAENDDFLSDIDDAIKAIIRMYYERKE